MFRGGGSPTVRETNGDGSTRCSLTSLPLAVVLGCVLPHLSALDLCRLAGVCRVYRSRFGAHEPAWRALVRAALPVNEFAVFDAPYTAAGSRDVPAPKHAGSAAAIRPSTVWKAVYRTECHLSDERASLFTPPAKAAEHSTVLSSTGYVIRTAATRARYRVFVRSSVPGCGSSSLIARFAKDKYSERYRATIGADFEAATVYHNGIEISLEIWDASDHGFGRHNSGMQNLYRRCDAFVLCYSVLSRRSFDALTEEIDATRTKRAFGQQFNTPNDVLPPFVVVGIDATDGSGDAKREVSRAEADEFFRTQFRARNPTPAAAAPPPVPIPYFECSPKTGRGVIRVFRQIARYAYATVYTPPLAAAAIKTASTHTPSQQTAAACQGMCAVQ